MEEMTTEKKLQLVQQIRSQHNRNQYDLSTRERILYEHSSAKITPLYNGSNYSEKLYHENAYSTNIAFENEEYEKNTSESLKFRSAFAVMLLLFAILFDSFKIAPAGIEMQQIFQMIATDYQENVTEFVETMTQEHLPNDNNE